MSSSFSSQAARPGGIFGRMIGELMAATNRPRNRWLVEQLDIRPGHAGLEFGFGNGEVLEAFLDRALEGTAVGLDWSQAMLDTAAVRNRQAIHAGRLRLIRGSIADPDIAFDGPFDRIWSSNVVQMLEDRPQIFARLRALLKEGGVLATCFQRRGDAPPAGDLASIVEVELAAAGFSSVETRWLPGSGEPAFCILATQ